MEPNLPWFQEINQANRDDPGDPDPRLRRILLQLLRPPTMSSPPPALLELLPLHALGALDEREAAEVERALAAHPALHGELAHWRDAITALGEAMPPEPPTPSMRSRLLDALVAAPLERFSSAVASLFDVTVERARAALARVGDATAWRPMMPGVTCIPVAPGPRWADASCALLRVEAGTTFPWHRHRGEEASLVLHGGAHMSDGRDLVPGDLLVVDETLEHDFTIEGPDHCIFAVRAHGIDIIGKP
jgi:anti-sigma factor ChrR (cupin superfamily)